MSTIGVCGFGRCGSSMAMAMLDAGGVPPVEGSSPGSYELPGLENMADVPAETLNGRAIKLLDAISYYRLPKVPEWRFLWIDRDPVQQARSMVKFSEAVMGIEMADDDVERFAQSYRDDRSRVIDAYNALGKLFAVDYEDVLADPLRCAQFISGLVPAPFDVEAAAAVVQKRPPECAPDLAFERSRLS